MNGGSLELIGHGKFRLSRGGILIEEWEHSNLITDTGRIWAADRMTDKLLAEAGWIAVGDGTGQTVSDTTLDNETGRVALTSPYPNAGVGADAHKMLFVCNVPAGTATGTISEVGIFNAASVGTMIDYLSGFAPKSKAVGDDLDIDITISVG